MQCDEVVIGLCKVLTCYKVIAIPLFQLQKL